MENIINNGLRSIMRIMGWEKRFLSGLASEPGYFRFLESECVSNPQFFIEISSICNFKCFYCNSPKSKRKGFMDEKLFYHVLDQADQVTTQSIRLHNDGEPTLHKKFYEFSRAVNEKGFRVALVTNGSKLEDKFLYIDMDININFSLSKVELARRSNMRFDKYIDLLKNYLLSWKNSSSRQNLRYNIYSGIEERSSKDIMKEKKEFVEKFLFQVGISCEVDVSKPIWAKYEKADDYKFSVNNTGLASGGLYPDIEKKVKSPLKKNVGKTFGFCVKTDLGKI